MRCHASRASSGRSWTSGHTRAVPSAEPVTIRVPSGLNPAEPDLVLVAAQDQGLPLCRQGVVQHGPETGDDRAIRDREEAARESLRARSSAVTASPA